MFNVKPQSVSQHPISCIHRPIGTQSAFAHHRFYTIHSHKFLWKIGPNVHLTATPPRIAILKADAHLLGPETSRAGLLT